MVAAAPRKLGIFSPAFFRLGGSIGGIPAPIARKTRVGVWAAGETQNNPENPLDGRRGDNPGPVFSRMQQVFPISLAARLAATWGAKPLRILK